MLPLPDRRGVVISAAEALSATTLAALGLATVGAVAASASMLGEGQAKDPRRLTQSGMDKFRANLVEESVEVRGCRQLAPQPAFHSRQPGQAPHKHDTSRCLPAPRARHPHATAQDFDQVLALAPKMRPYMWQRGLSLYYLGRFEDGAQQFRDDVAVNPNDTEEVGTPPAPARAFGKGEGGVEGRSGPAVLATAVPSRCMSGARLAAQPGHRQPPSPIHVGLAVAAVG
jgi:hypothetical protein